MKTWTLIVSAAFAVSGAPAAAAEGAPPQSEPIARPGIAALKNRIIEAMEDGKREPFFDELAITAPVTGGDVGALFDLFLRFPESGPRQAVLQSLALMPQSSPQLEPLFINYLRQPDPESRFFGVNGAFRLRSQSALPFVRAIASRKFNSASSNDNSPLIDRNDWWTQYEALSALARWEGEKALPLLERRAQENPEVARLLGQYFWAKTLPKLKEWSRSSNDRDRERARRTAEAPIVEADARSTRAAMLAMLRDAKTDYDVRHRLALKIGAVADETEAAELVRGHDAAASDRDRLLWAAATFASRRQTAVPLIARYARESTDETTRDGARLQLENMLGAEQAKALLDGEGKKGPEGVKVK